MVESFLKAAKKREKKKAEIAEVDIEDTFVKYAKRKGCRALKLVLLNKRGFPDRTVLCPNGRIFFIEFKRKNKKPSPSQIVVKTLLVSLGFQYHVCDRLGQAEKQLDRFLDD